MILWTSIGRTDYYQTGHWYSKINAYSQDPEIPLNCPDGAEITNFALMYAIHELLTYKQIPFRSMTWSTYNTRSGPALLYQSTVDKIEQWIFDKNNKFFSRKYQMGTPLSDSFQNIYDTMKGPDWPPLENILADDYTTKSISLRDEIERFKQMLILENKGDFLRSQVIDRHPLPSQHLAVAKKICPDIKLRQSVIDWINDLDTKILSEKPYNFQPSVPINRIQI